MDLFLRFVFWVFGLFVSRTQAEGAKEERANINTASAAQLQRQDAVASKPVSNAELDKSLRNGTF